MVSPLLILLAALFSGAAVAVAARFVHWPLLHLILAGAGTFVAVLGWRLLANILSLNEDFMPAVSIADTACLVAGGLPPALVTAARPLSRKSVVVAAGAIAAFVVNVVIL